MMRRILLCSFALCAFASVAAAIAPGPYYARGDFQYVASAPGSTNGLWGYTPEAQLFDDGLHGDGAANDGVYGAYVVCNTSPGYHEFKIANADWSFSEPSTWSAPLANGRLFVNYTGETIFFRLDTTPQGGGWLPDIAVANDHAYPAGTQLELIGSAPELGSWLVGEPVDHNGAIWTREVFFATPGAYEYKFRVTGTWDYANFGVLYNNNMGANGTFDVTQQDESITIQFNEVTGRIRAVSTLTPTRQTTWGRIKSDYR